MKKRLILSALLVIAILLGVFGPDLLDVYRLDQYIKSTGNAAGPAAEAWPSLTEACIGCHGSAGNSRHQGYPSLAGQPAPYIATQLHRFADGQRDNPNMRPLAMTLSDAEVTRIAQHFSAVPATPNIDFKPDPAAAARGKQVLASSNCAACHGPALMGRDQFPRLAGQGYDYLVVQLDAFASGARKDPAGAMNALAASLSPQDRRAVASLLASMSPGTP